MSENASNPATEPFNCPNCGAHDYGLYFAAFGCCVHCVKAERDRLRSALVKISIERDAEKCQKWAIQALSAEPSSDETKADRVRDLLAWIDGEQELRRLDPTEDSWMKGFMSALDAVKGHLTESAEKASVDGQQVAVAQESLKCSKCGNTWMSIPRMGIISACGLDPSKTMAQCEHGPLAQNGEAKP